jgi:hypothetical protein
MPSTIEKPLGHLQRHIEELKASLALPAYESAAGKQSQILGHFLSRALQMSEASNLICRAKLGTPLFVLTRVLCEDLFLCQWVSLSENNAAEYSSAVISGGAKMIGVLLRKDRGQIVDRSTREVKTDEFMPHLDNFKADRVHIEQLAGRLVLSKVYDLVYRPFSMEVHGKVFGLPSTSEQEPLYAALSAIVSLVKSIGLIADNRVLRNQTTKPDEILHVLRLDQIAGK